MCVIGATGVGSVLTLLNYKTNMSATNCMTCKVMSPSNSNIFEGNQQITILIVNTLKTR
jgi:hypothetical protein